MFFVVVFLGLQIYTAQRLLRRPESLSALMMRCDECESALTRETEASSIASKTADRLMHLQVWALGLYKLQKNIGELDQITRRANPSFVGFYDSFLAPLHQRPHEFFGFDDRDRWNLCVYLYYDNVGELRPVWRRTDPRHPSLSGNGARGKAAFGRSWRPGQGHTGMAFAQNTSFITEDIQKSDLYDTFMSTGANFKHYDPNVYRSFASIPFGSLSGRCIGVLVVTSDRPGAVNEAIALPLRHAAAVFTNLTDEIVALQELLT